MELLTPVDLSVALDAVTHGSVPLAGGTDLMVEVNFGHRHVDSVVALRRIDELTAWEDGRIGGAVNWRRIEREGPTALAQAARTVGSPQIRNAGTIGGNVATASPAGDGLPFLLAANARIEARSATDSRLLEATEFFTGVKRTALEPDELVTAVHLPEDLPEFQAFGKVGVRDAMVIATVSAVVLRRSDGTTTVAMGSVAPTPVRARAAESMISAVSTPSDADLTEFARLVSQDATPITDHRSTAEYRSHAVGVLARRLLERCLRAAA